MRESEYDANLYMSGSTESRRAACTPSAVNESEEVAGRSRLKALATTDGVAPVPLTPDWNAPNGHLIPESLRRAGAVIDAGCKQRWTALERAERRREYGAKAIGMLEALLNMGELRECYREQAREIVSEWDK